MIEPQTSSVLHHGHLGGNESLVPYEPTPLSSPAIKSRAPVELKTEKKKKWKRKVISATIVANASEKKKQNANHYSS